MTQISIENVAYYRSHQYTSLQVLKQPGEMHGARRVVVFCLLIAVLPTTLLIVSLYLRHSVYADVKYAVAESDVLEVVDGMSTIFCQEQVLAMNTTFHAFQLKSIPKLSHYKKHIHLKKSMVLPDDTLEYWGFFLLRGSQVTIKTCSRYAGARVLMVEGEKNLRTCGLMQHKKYPPNPSHPVGGLGFVHSQKPIVVIPVTGKPNPVRRPDDQMTEREEEFEGENVAEEEEDDNTSKEVSKFVNGKAINSSHNEIKGSSDIKSAILDGDYDHEDNAGNSTDLLGEESLQPSFENFEDGDSGNKNMTYAGSPSEERKGEITSKNQTPQRKVRHAKRRLLDMDRSLGYVENDKNKNAEWVLRRARLQETLNGQKSKEWARKEEGITSRKKRDIKSGIMLDGGIGHGGNAGNYSDLLEEESSQSSFELNLMSCYKDKDIFTLDISPSHRCTQENVDNDYTYNVTSDGYYYYIFYSDNDFYQNTIHADFDIFKTTYEFTNYTRGCINRTECSFPISFWSDDIVIAEIPTRDGIEHEDDDMSYLVSSCYPRMSVYIIFPVAVLFLILGCAFL